MLFSERIRTLRREQKKNQRKLAAAIGVDVPMYSRFEHGGRRPKREQVLKLARIFGVDAGELVALWLAEEAMNAIGHDTMSGRAAQLLRDTLNKEAQVNAEPAPAQVVPAPAPVAAPTRPEVDPTLIKAPELGPSQRTLLDAYEYYRTPLFFHGDARLVMQGIPDESVDVVVTTPPYWSLRFYRTESIAEKDMGDFIDGVLRVMAEVKRVLKPWGSLWLNVGDAYENRSLQALPWRIAIKMMDLQGWILRNDVVWNKPQGNFENAPDHLRNVHEFMFHFVKSKYFYFDDNALRRTYDRSQERTRTGRKAAQVAEPDLMPGDVWQIDTEKSGIDRYRVSPELLCRLPIVTTSQPDGLVLDPYCGTGTTCKVAYDLDRRSIGIDVNEDRLARARERIEQKPLSLF